VKNQINKQHNPVQCQSAEAQTTTSGLVTDLTTLTVLDFRAPVSPFFPFLPNLLNLRLELNFEETVTLIAFFNFVLPSTLDPISIYDLLK
jgi:hypothetical protein